MANRQRDTKKRRKTRPPKKGTEASPSRAKRKAGRGIDLMASASDRKRSAQSVERILEYYRPLKKPITLRLDADVLAWFKKDGRRYQTRINSALRTVMEREMKK